jgi:hypothetical protein
MLARMQRKKEPFYTFVEMSISATAMDSHTEVFQKTKNRTTLKSSSATPEGKP